METVFLDILNVSITASYLVLAVLVLRPLLKKAPKALTAGLWALVGIRLLCPFSIESVFSLIPSAQTVPPEILTTETPMIHSGISFVNSAVNPVISHALAPQNSVSPVLTLTQIAGGIWIAGLVLMLLYSGISYGRLYHRVRINLPLGDNVYLCDRIDTPFILGIVKPRIYLPSGISEEQSDYVLAHEFAHLKRKDHWWKPLGFLLLSIHWFNPLMWVAYILLCRDIELACDEKVIRTMDREDKKGYSEALLACSLQRRLVMTCPLAFGEVAVKDRIKSVFSYKKPAFWIVLIALVVCIALGIGFLTDPVSTGEIDEVLSVFLDVQISNHHLSEHSEDRYCAADFEVLGTKKHGDKITVYMWVLYAEYEYDTEPRDVSGSHIVTAITAKKVDDNYELVEYWEPRDGTYYTDDIKAKFPLRLRAKAFDGQRYIDAQQARLDAKAEAFYAFSVVEGIYQYHDSVDPLTPQLTLYDGQRFHFRYSGFSSYYAVGSYQIKDNQLILSTNDGYYTYVFDVKGDSFIFDADSSSPIPQYKYSGSSNRTQSPVPDGAEFKKDLGNMGLQLTPPPILNVSCGERSVRAWTGTYSWETRNADGTIHGINADSSHPLSCLDSVPSLPLMPTAISAIDLYHAMLTFSQVPKKITVTRYPISSTPTEATSQEAVRCTDSSFSLPYGMFLYEIVVQFDSADGSGTVHYAFATSTPAIGYITQDEFGLTMDATVKNNNKIKVTFTHNEQNATISGQLTTGDPYDILASHNGEWITLENYLTNILHYDYNKEDIIFRTWAKIIKRNGTTIMTHDLSVHGTLPPGTYRLCKTVTLTQPTGERISKVYTADFAIVD